MADFSSHVLSNTGDEESSMAVDGAFLAAHHCNVVLLSEIEEVV